jgi:hypothetical protein
MMLEKLAPPELRYAIRAKDDNRESTGTVDIAATAHKRSDTGGMNTILTIDYYM